MKTARVVALITLGLLGVTAILGAIPMVTDPSGRMMQMPLSMLADSPFRSFLIPGIIPLIANGLLSLTVLALVERRVPGYGNLIVLQGFVISGWITAEVILLQTVVWLHWIYWTVGVVLIVCGMVRRSAVNERVARIHKPAEHHSLITRTPTPEPEVDEETRRTLPRSESPRSKTKNRGWMRRGRLRRCGEFLWRQSGLALTL